MAYIGKQITINGVIYTPLSADPPNAVEGQTFYSDGTVRNEGLWVFKNGAWTSVGSGSGQKNFFPEGDADQSLLSDWTSGNNASFDGGGSLAGVYSLSTTSTDLIDGLKVFKYVGSATALSNDNDYIASPTISIPLGYRGRSLGLEFQYKWDGVEDVTVVVKDETNSTILTTSLDVLKTYNNSNTAVGFSTAFFCPINCTEIKVGFQTLTGEVSKTLLFDDIVVTPDPFVYKNLADKQYLKHEGTNGFGSSATKIIRVVAPSVAASQGEGILEFADDATNSSSWTAKKDCYVDFSFVFRTGGSNFLHGISLSASSLSTDIDALADSEKISWSEFPNSGNSAPTHSASFFMSAGQVARIHTQGVATTFTNGNYVNIVATAISEHVVTPQSSIDAMIRLHTNNGWGSTNTRIRRMSNVALGVGAAFSAIASTQQNGPITVTDSAANGTEITLNESGYYSISYSDNAGASVADFGLSLNSTQLSTDIFSINAEDRLDYSVINGSDQPTSMGWAGFLSKNDVIRMHGDNSGSPASPARASFTISKIGFKALSAVGSTKVAYIKDIKSSNTVAQSLTSGVDNIRQLNTLSGDSEIVSLSLNQFTLKKGTYNISFDTPANNVAETKAWLYNVTNSSDAIVGSIGYDAGALTTYSRGADKIVLQQDTTFEIRQSVAVSGNGGIPFNDGRVEVYTTVKVEGAITNK